MSIHKICFHGDIRNYYLDTHFIDLELRISTWKRVKLRIDIFSTSRLLIDGQSVLQNR